VKALLTGASSLLGWELLKQMPEDWSVATLLHRNADVPSLGGRQTVHHVDVTDEAAVYAAVHSVKPDVILHLGSQGNLELCKTNPAEAFRVNVGGTRNLLLAAAPFGSKFVFTSTMYVFDGSRPPYGESDTPNPVNEYGSTKLEAERLVFSQGSRPVVMRPMTIYGWHSPKQRANWVTWLLQRLRRNESTPVVTDVYSNPLWVGDAAAAILAAARKDVGGIFHLGGMETSSRFDFSVAVAKAFDCSEDLLIPVTSDYFPQLAHRPSSAICKVGKMIDVLGVTPLDLRSGLERMRAAAPREHPSLRPGSDIRSAAVANSETCRLRMARGASRERFSAGS
jgi:dTDP-4-dehydrorhamnose reductase